MALDDVELPQRPRAIQRQRHDPRDLVGELLVGARRRERHLAHVVAEVDLGLLDPVRMVEPERHLGEAPAQRRQLGGALLDQPRDLARDRTRRRARSMASSIARLPTWPVWREFSRARNCASRLVSCRIPDTLCVAARLGQLRSGKVRDVSPSAGTRPDAAQLVDLDELLAAYRRPPAGPVSFGTSGHRGTSLKGTFTEAHVLAISEAIVRHRRAQGIDGPLFVARDTHALSEPAFHTALEVFSRPWARGPRRRRRRLHADARALARDPHPQPRRRAAGRRDRAHAVAQPARGRRLQVQPAERRAGGHVDHQGHRGRGQPPDRGRPHRGQARGAPSTTPHDYVSAYVNDLPNVIDIDAIRDGRRAHRRRPARRRERRLLPGDQRPARARPDRRQRGGRPDLPLRPARPRRQDPHGLLVAVRDERADRAARPLRRRRRLRPGRRPPRHRRAEHRAAEPQPLPRGRDPLPVRRRARLAGRAPGSARRSCRAR